MLLRIPAAFSLIAVLCGCAAAAIGGGTYAVKAAQRDDLRPSANAGNAEAQYRLGKSWCCMGPGFDTQKATEWLCRAAAQGHELALHELGRIYDGQVSRTPAPGQKLIRIAAAKRSTPHALAFYSLAANLGNPDSVSRKEEIAQKLEAAEQYRADAISSDFSSSCTYEQVFGNLHTKEEQS